MVALLMRSMADLHRNYTWSMDYVEKMLYDQVREETDPVSCGLVWHLLGQRLFMTCGHLMCDGHPPMSNGHPPESDSHPL